MSTNPAKPEKPAAAPTDDKKAPAAAQVQMESAASTVAPVRLGEKLVNLGLISQDQLQIVITEQKNTKKLFGAILVEMGFVTESALGEVLAESSGTEKFDSKSTMLDSSVVQRIPKELAARHKIIPVSYENDVLQLAMGWTDSHLHEFRIGQERFGTPDPDDQFMDLSEVSNERSVHLFKVLGKARAKAIYTYDFGDCWEHAIVVEKVLQPEPGIVYPMCVGGKLHCPPEDCGSIPGFYNLLEAIRDPTHEEHEAMMDWLGGRYDPEAFSVEEVNRRLMPLQRCWARREKE